MLPNFSPHPTYILNRPPATFTQSTAHITIKPRTPRVEPSSRKAYLGIDAKRPPIHNDNKARQTSLQHPREIQARTSSGNRAAVGSASLDSNAN